MNADCRSFRRTLQRALEDSRSAAGRSSLSWHEHLLGCGDCRALLEAEEALETLLETLPEPQLPPQLARRVLARLRSGAESGEAALDRLLELDREASAPPGLARALLAQLEAERAQPAHSRLDALLERAREVEVPAGLAQRVLAHVAEERRLARPRRTPARRRALWLAAAACVLLAAAWSFWPGRPPAREVAQAPDPADPRLLEHIELLEHWEFLQRNDLDTLLSTLPQRDQLLFEMGSEEGLLGG